MPTNSVLELENVSFAYNGKPVLSDVSFTMRRGDYLGLIGPNGAGKTTLLKIILGLMRPSAGRVRLFGQESSRFREGNRIGYVPQRPMLDPLFPASVREVVAMGRYGRAGLLRGLTGADHAAVQRAIRLANIEHLAARRVGELSGGEQQRVLIARALASEPDLILLDEPAAAIDVEAQERFYALLERLNRVSNKSLLLVSHDLEAILSHVREVICINQSVFCTGLTRNFQTRERFLQFYRKEMKAAHAHG